MMTEDGSIRAHDMVPGLHAREEFGGDVGLDAVMTELERIQVQGQGRSPVLRHRLQSCFQDRRESIRDQQHPRAQVFQQQEIGRRQPGPTSWITSTVRRACRGSNSPGWRVWGADVDFLFPSRLHDSPHLGIQQYARILGHWVDELAWAVSTTGRTRCAGRSRR